MCEKPKRTLIKICGLTTEQDVVYANTFLPDFAGFVLFCPKSRRNLDLPAAAALRRKLSPRIKSVAVVVSPSVQQVREIESQGFDYIQIHGSLPEEVYEAIHLPVLRAVQADDIETFAAKEGAGAFAGTFAAMRDLSRIAGYVFDAREPGSGKCFDWSLLDGLERDGKLLFLAGGIHEGNVQEAIRRVRPDGIDVSSAVEVAGQQMFRGKDPEKMKKIIRMVHSYD